MVAAQAVHDLGAAVKPSRIWTDIDVRADGKQDGYLNVPYSRNDSAWGSVRLPITIIKNGTGPTLLFTAGSHGDEYEGPIALMKLARDLTPERLNGRVIILPAMNMPAVRSGTRLSPLDGLNMNRIFPGRRDGTVTLMIAHYVYTHLMPLADVVVDLHSGGKTLDFVPSAVMHHLDDPVRMGRTLAAVQAFGAPLGLVLRELDNEGMFDTVVEEAGRIFISTELGGYGTATTRTVDISDIGVRNLLCHFGLLDEQPVRPETLGRAPTRLMHTPDADCFVMAEDGGIYEILADTGTWVEKGDPIGRIHFYEHPDRPTVPYHARRSGIIYSRHAPGLVQAGDSLAVIAMDYTGPIPATS
jgi:N-alpha-acetyl-L-2,4-diaminobutyrate deacetylase